MKIIHMKKLCSAAVAVVLFSLSLLSCNQNPSCHTRMLSILDSVKKKSETHRNLFASKAKIPYMDSLLAIPHAAPVDIRFCKYLKSQILMEVGEETVAVKLLEDLEKEEYMYGRRTMVLRDLGMAYLRQGERSNCISNHAAESCILPIKGMGVHRDQSGSRKAIEIFTKLLDGDPKDLESRWLLNLAYLTLGEYPQNVPPAFFIPGMEGDTTTKVKPFEDIAADLKLDVNNMAGGSIIEDFDNDGYLDIVTSGLGLEDEMHYFKNNADGTYSDITEKTHLKGITGGLNIVQTDYNNDGFKDIFVLRGAWKMEYGNEPNSLLQNNGDGTFTDVTIKAGLLSFHPTQTATWNDFNNDGWVDVFIGNENFSQNANTPKHPCELYMNNQDGTFREVARQANCNILNFVKGVTSGDYDHDGWQDVFISTMDGERKLLKNVGMQGKEIAFKNVTAEAGLNKAYGRSFPTWFWDYDNDGWLDIFACDYTFTKSLGYYEAAEKLGVPAGNPEKMLLYRNNHDGTFTDVANNVGLNTNAFAMGANFGDIDNDGFLDMYLGTGNPNYQSLVPNKMFKNVDGKKFADVTASARVGHLQKGHAVSFADVDNDGDQDIYIEMGGAYVGDAYQNSFFLNPGQNDNHWISIQLEGTKSNRAAIGTSLVLTFTENGVTRRVYRDVNSGGSFGSSPLRREIGLGKATQIDELEIRWHGSSKIQLFRNIKPDQFIKITEGVDSIRTINLKKLNWTLPDKLCLPTTSENRSSESAGTSIVKRRS